MVQSVIEVLVVVDTNTTNNTSTLKKSCVQSVMLIHFVQLRGRSEVIAIQIIRPLSSRYITVLILKQLDVTLPPKRRYRRNEYEMAAEVVFNDTRVEMVGKVNGGPPRSYTCHDSSQPINTLLSLVVATVIKGLPRSQGTLDITLIVKNS